ncbi:MAG: hypothetical protein M0D55_15120 [Elusimicrobiota bacterium]|nr:MAG: hypothetical protein M0D55_15120 [Elusimicrobiota bacterium]
MDMLPGGRPQARKVVYLRTEGDGKREVKIGVPTLEKLAKQIGNFSKGSGLTREEFLEKLRGVQATVRSEFVTETANAQFSLGSPAQERSVIKTALELWALRVGKKEVLAEPFKQAREFVNSGMHASWFALFAGADPDWQLPSEYSANEFSHVMLLWSDSNGRVVGHYQLFGHIHVAIRLCVSGATPNAFCGIAQNPLTTVSTYFDTPPGPLRAPATLDSLVVDLPKMRERVIKLLTRAKERSVELWQEEMIGKATAQSLAGTGVVQPEQIADLSSSIAEEVVKLVFRLPGETKLAGDELVKRLLELEKKAQDA